MLIWIQRHDPIAYGLEAAGLLSLCRSLILWRTSMSGSMDTGVRVDFRLSYFSDTN